MQLSLLILIDALVNLLCVCVCSIEEKENFIYIEKSKINSFVNVLKSFVLRICWTDVGH